VKRNVALVIILGMVTIAVVIGMSPWLVVGPRRWVRSRLRRKDNGMMRAIGNGRKHG
jgi:hypothetical protein